MCSFTKDITLIGYGHSPGCFAWCALFESQSIWSCISTPKEHKFIDGMKHIHSSLQQSTLFNFIHNIHVFMNDVTKKLIGLCQTRRCNGVGPTHFQTVGRWLIYIVAAWVVRSKAATACLYWMTHSCLIWKRIMHCLFYNTLLQTGLLFMCPIVVQPNTNICSNTTRNHFWCSSPVDFPMKCLTVDNTYVCCNCIP